MTTPSPSQTEKNRILIIEDDAGLRKMIMTALDVVGLEGHNAADGPAGLTAFKEVNPHLVLLDLMMPGMDGREVCKQIRERSKVPIIILTAEGGDAAQLECFEIGADDYITKPFDTRSLIMRVLAQLRRVYHYDQAVIKEGGAAPEAKAATP